MRTQESPLEREWAKIKDYDICTKEELEKKLAKKPKGKCYRKYPHMPWSKPNFFFGTYDELLKYYKTSKEVPFYLNSKIGKRHGKLTIKSFSYNQDHQIVANCQCDCGNRASFVYEKLLDNELKSCGCLRPKKKTEEPAKTKTAKKSAAKTTAKKASSKAAKTAQKPAAKATATKVTTKVAKKPAAKTTTKTTKKPVAKTTAKKASKK